MKQILFLLFVFLGLNSYCQSTDILNKVAEQSAENTVKELKDLEQDNKKRIITVVPFLSSDGEFTSESKEFTKKYIELLNKKIKAANLNFSAVGEEFDDPEFSDLLRKTTLDTKDDSKYWEKYLKKINPKYIIKGNYKIDKSENRLYFENVKIYNNWMEEEFVDKVSVIDASAEMFKKYVSHSIFVPGLGQVKRGQKKTGYTIMAISGVTLTSTILMESLRQIMLSKAERNPYSTVYKDNAAIFGTLRTVSIIGFGATYIFNIASAVAYKPKNNYLSNIYFTPNYTRNQFYVTLSFNLNY
ncbi:MAG: hypothetical protein U9Q83_04500 [Bacteroidota bacterium]|nr:hypothetical protein [Bacteroidota bacterium]